MTQTQLQSVMKFQLKTFNDEGVTIDDSTIHDTVLSATDGFGDSNSKNLYVGVIRHTLKRNGHEDKPWPTDWFSNDVTYLASKII